MAPLLVAFASLTATLLRALLVQARVLPPACARCGLPFERRRLGDLRCTCARDA